MRRSHFKRALGAGLAFAASASVMLSAGTPAYAASDTIAVAGSDTTMDVMTAIVAADGTPGKTFNIKAGNFQSTPLTVPADSSCNAFTYHNKSTGTWPASGAPQQAVGETAAPDGSGEGRNALALSVAGTAPFNAQPGGTPNGCVDIARSSSAKSGTDPGTRQFYAFGVDGVTWGTSSLNAPSAMTLSQVQGIYNCTFTDWSQVGGSPGPIQRTLPQSGSGTGSFFLTNVLGVPNQAALPAGTAGTACKPIVNIQENQFFDMYHGSSTYGPPGNAAEYANAIGGYSSGKWTYQAGKDTNPTIDLRSGFRPGALIVAQGTNTVADYQVQWTGSAWALNNANVVGSAATAPRVENLTTTLTTPTTVSLVSTTHGVASVTTVVGSFTVTAAAGSFTQDDVGSPISGTGIAASTNVSAVSANGSSATLDKAAIAAGTVTLTLSSVFHSSDAGAVLSGNVNIPVGTTITYVLNKSTAFISAGATAAATGVATTITPVGQVHNVASVTSTATSTSISAAAGTFTTADVGKVIDSPNLFPNTHITGFGGGGSTATISPAAKSTGSASAAIGFAVISQGNVLASVGPQAPFPGARFVWNVIDSTTPSYTLARNLIGYDDVPSGAKSPLCNAVHDVDNGGADSIIADNGFLPLEPHTSAGGNTGVTCFKV